MRTSIFAMVVVAASAVVFPTIAQQKPGPQQAAPSEQTKGQMHQDVDKDLKTTGQANEQMQRDADKGVKTRNSGESGYVGDQDKPGASFASPSILHPNIRFGERRMCWIGDARNSGPSYCRYAVSTGAQLAEAYALECEIKPESLWLPIHTCGPAQLAGKLNQMRFTQTPSFVKVSARQSPIDDPWTSHGSVATIADASPPRPAAASRACPSHDTSQ